MIDSRFSRPVVVSAFALGLAATAFGCDDPIVPEVVADTYVLAGIDGASLPVVILENGSVTVSVVDDTFRIRDDGTGSHTRTQHVVERGPEPTERSNTWTAEFTYESRGDGFAVSYECPPLASCIAPPHEIARWVPDGFVLESLPPDFVYVRLSADGATGGAGE